MVKWISECGLKAVGPPGSYLYLWCWTTILWRFEFITSEKPITKLERCCLYFHLLQSCPEQNEHWINKRINQSYAATKHLLCFCFCYLPQRSLMQILIYVYRSLHLVPHSSSVWMPDGVLTHLILTVHALDMCRFLMFKNRENRQWKSSANNFIKPSGLLDLHFKQSRHSEEYVLNVAGHRDLPDGTNAFSELFFVWLRTPVAPGGSLKSVQDKRKVRNRRRRIGGMV